MKKRSKVLSIDIETFSSTDIKLGVYKYSEDPTFEILMIAYGIDSGPIQMIDLKRGEKPPKDFVRMLTDETYLKTAYNAQFEFVCLSTMFDLDLSQWECTQALASLCGLPFGLDLVSKVLGSSELKDSEGKDLIKYFSIPCKPTKVNGMRTRNLPEHDMQRWEKFKDYCLQDVRTEKGIRDKISWFEIAEFEKPLWYLDQKINSTGVRIDYGLVSNAIEIDAIVKEDLHKEITTTTDIANPGSNDQIKKYIFAQTGKMIKSLNKADMTDIHKEFEGTQVGRVLKIRDMLSHAAVKKYHAMSNSVCSDMRVRGLFRYNGANRTGRWSSVNIQLQNLKRNDLEDLDFARELVRKGNLDALRFSYEDVGSVLGNLVRTAFISEPGKKLIASDFSAIEARVIAWFAKEDWRIDVFKTHGKIYEASASMMFKIPIEKVDKSLRQKGKIAELALGYQGSVGAMEAMGGARMGLTEEDMKQIVKRWRAANKKIVKFWYDVEGAAKEVLMSRKKVKLNHLEFYMKESHLIIKLPSGRELVYWKARLSSTNSIVYWGMNQTTKQWSVQDTYGGKLVENIVQACSRDILADAMIRADKAGFKIVMHVHDEIVAEEKETRDESELTKILRTPIPWAPGLPLGAETFCAKYYQK